MGSGGCGRRWGVWRCWFRGFSARRGAGEVVTSYREVVVAFYGWDFPERVVVGQEDGPAGAEASGDDLGEGGEVRDPTDGAPAEIDEVEVDQVGWEVEDVGLAEVGFDAGVGGLASGHLDGDVGDVDAGRDRAEVAQDRTSSPQEHASWRMRLPWTSPAQFLLVVLEDDASGPEELGRPAREAAMVFQPEAVGLDGGASGGVHAQHRR